jgi:hypothetical protein
MAKLTAAARKKLPSKSFALPGKGEGKSGKGSGSYPIPDPSHARNALARVSQHGTPSEKATVRAKVHQKFPSIGKKQFGGVAPSARVARPPRIPAMPKAPGLIGAPRRAKAPKALAPRIGGRLSSAAGMKKGGVAYAHGGVATCGNLKDAGGFKEMGIG